MFVRQSTHAAVVCALLEMQLRYKKLLSEWNALVETVNAKGGHAFLKNGSSAFTADELTTLVALCHPDKHGGSKQAEEMTIKLLALRKDTLVRKET